MAAEAGCRLGLLSENQSARTAAAAWGVRARTAPLRPAESPRPVPTPAVLVVLSSRIRRSDPSHRPLHFILTEAESESRVKDPMEPLPSRHQPQQILNPATSSWRFATNLPPPMPCPKRKPRMVDVRWRNQISSVCLETKLISLG